MKESICGVALRQRLLDIHLTSKCADGQIRREMKEICAIYCSFLLT